MSERTCKGITKKGKPCKAAPLKDRDVCLAHADAATRESTGFVPDNGKGGRPRTPRVVDVIREMIEEEMGPVLQALFEGLEADQGIALNVRGGGMEIGYVPDHATRIRAAKEILDRAYGRPKQETELTGPGGGPIEHDHVGIPTSQDFQSGVAAVLATAGAHGNGNGSS